MDAVPFSGLHRWMRELHGLRSGANRPLLEVVRSVQGVTPIAHHDELGDIDSRLLFRGWTKSSPAVSTLAGHPTDVERVGWLRDVLAQMPAAPRCYIGVGSGRDWLEIELAADGVDAALLDAVLSAGALHNPNLKFVDVCLLAADHDSVLMIRKTDPQMAAFVFRSLRERHQQQLRSRAEARGKYLQGVRQKVESVPGLMVRDGLLAAVGLPSGEVLSAEFEDPFDLPHIHENNERAREPRDRWLRDRLRSTPFAAPNECFLWEGGTKAGPWWRLGLPAREGWASDLLYAVAGTRVGDGWSSWLHWSERFLFLSSDATWVMSWEITEHLFHVHVYRTSVLLERARSRSRLGEWLASQEDVLAWRADRSGTRAAGVLRRKWQFATLQDPGSRERCERWLLEGLRRLSPRCEEERLGPGQGSQLTGSARISIGETVLPWTQIFWRDTTWLPRLWEELRPACLFIEARPQRWRGWYKMDDGPRVLGFRRTARTCEAFLCTPSKRRGVP